MGRNMHLHRLALSLMAAMRSKSSEEDNILNEFLKNSSHKCLVWCPMIGVQVLLFHYKDKGSKDDVRESVIRSEQVCWKIIVH